jgi:hypothetical protein
MPTSILRELLLLMPSAVIEREVRKAGHLEPHVDRHLAVDIPKFKQDIQQAVILTPQLRRDCYLWFILVNMLHDDTYLAALTEHEPQPRKRLFIEECIKMSAIFATRGTLLCKGVFPDLPAPISLPSQLLTPSIAVEYLTLVYSQL